MALVTMTVVIIGSEAEVLDREDHAIMSARRRGLIDRLRGLGTAGADAQLKLFEEITASMLVHDAIIRRGAGSRGPLCRDSPIA
jgi:hypothetical protein